MINRFAGTLAVITGAGRGIGKQIARDMIAEGAKVYIPDLDFERSREAARELGECAIPAALDVRRCQDVGAFFDRVEAEGGRLNYLVNCAGGYTPLVPSLRITEEEYDLVLDSNLKGTFFCCQAAIERMARGGGGAIVNFSSVAARQISLALGPHYTAAKAGVLGLTRHFAKEFGPQGIRVNAMAPGSVEGERYGGLVDSAKRQRELENIPLQRFAAADDISAVALFLLSDASRYITGATVDVNGGLLTI
jgi:NAD(P)-dependent dehydrogenase (short-subunit alcohol dehydrogenase family)